MYLDQFIKISTVLVALIPLFVWLDRAKRFTHRRKFYLNRLDAVKDYIKDYYNSDKQKLEKDCAAQALVCSERTSHLEIDYVLQEFPQRFFIMIKKLITARHFIDTKIIDNKINLISRSSKNNLKKKRLIFVGTYVSSIIIIPLNSILLFIINKIEFFSPFYVDNWVIGVGTVSTFLIGIFTAFSSAFFFNSIDTTIEIFDDLKVKYIPINQDS